jgi:uncharacterized protein YaaQ
MEQCRLNAKACIQQGKKQMALRYLKKKKSLVAAVQEKEQAIDKLNNLILAIQDTDSQKQIMDALSTGVQAYKGATNKLGLNDTTIDNIMADIQEVFEANEEMNQSISQPIGPAEDEEELETELQDLLGFKTPQPTKPMRLVSKGREAQPQRDRSPAAEFDVDSLLSADLVNLPDVPSHDPSRSNSLASKSNQIEIT